MPPDHRTRHALGSAGRASAWYLIAVSLQCAPDGLRPGVWGWEPPWSGDGWQPGTMRGQPGPLSWGSVGRVDRSAACRAACRVHRDVFGMVDTRAPLGAGGARLGDTRRRGPDRARQRDLPQQGMPLTSHAHCTEVDRHEQAPGPCPAPARPRATRRQRRALRQGHPERRGRASLRWRARARRRRSGHRRARRRKAGAGEGWRPAEACGRGGGAAVMLPIRREAPETRWEKGVWHSASFGLEWQLPCPGT